MFCEIVSGDSERDLYVFKSNSNEVPEDFFGLTRF